MLDSLLVLDGQGSADILVEYMEYLILFHVRWKEASISSMNPVASLLILLIIIPSGQVGFVVIFHNRSKIKNIMLPRVNLKLFLLCVILSLLIEIILSLCATSIFEYSSIYLP